jgi:hypothetical protein
MVNLKQLLFESEEPQLSISIEDVQTSASSKWTNRDAAITLGVLEDFYFDADPKKQQYAQEYIDLLNRVLQHIIKIGAELGVGYVDLRIAKEHLLDQQGFKTNEEEFFPFPLYVAANKTPDEDWATVGIMVDQNGKVLEIHEGNDEATPETSTMVNKMVNPTGKKVRIYGLHGTAVVRKIEEMGYLPANLYVSPDRGHSSRHWDNTDRSMFTGIVNLNDLSQESDLDWKTIGITKIEKFRWA